MRLSDGERARIVEAIRLAEQQTSGEIACVLAQAASQYRTVPIAWAALVALLVPIPLIYTTTWSPTTIYILQLGAFIGTLMLLWNERVRYWIVPGRLRRDTAHGEALRQFAAQGLQHTAQRNGILIFVAIAERYAEVLPDAGIAKKVPPEAWDSVVADLTRAVRAGKPADGFVAAIGQCATILAAHFPPSGIDRDEIPNAIIEI